MKKPAIHQFHSGSAFGDAVTNSLLYTKKILNDLGYESNIYVEHVAPELKEEIRHYSKLKSDDNNIILIHHSMGHDLDDWIRSLKEKIVLVYHNITPADFFPIESPFHHYSIKGRDQLNLLRELAVGAIGVSHLNVEELRVYGFEKEKTRVIPLLIDYEKIADHLWNRELFDQKSKEFNLLFVGRIAENKAQLELVKMYQIFLQMYDLPSKLYLVGGTSGDRYEEEIRQYIAENGLQDRVVLTGKVSYEDLYAYYRLVDVFVCLSEHEGFGVPLIEAMIFDVPVIAYDSSNIKNTLDGGGVLFKEKNLEYIAGLIALIAKNRALRREIIRTQRDKVVKYKYENIKYQLAKFLTDLNLVKIDLNRIERSDHIKHTKVQIEGPFDSSYSLALLNREMAKALNDKLPDDVALFSTEGPGDYEPNAEFLLKNKNYRSMYLKGKKAYAADVVLRNLYPPRVYDAKGLINMMNSYGWEESAFPRSYIEEFNRHLDALPVMSTYVQKVMISNGITIPLYIVGVGVDHLLNVKSKKFKLPTKKKFKFLHISSCFPRKGVDILLQAYCDTFTREDDVSLVIKTFPNPHNDVEEQIASYKKNNPDIPEIILINRDLSDEYIVDLYQKCDCLVAPSRGEGFGLPMAEAMLFDLPVITTGYGGQTDFCTDETAWLIDYYFEKAKTHMGLFNSYWVEPEVAHLSKLLKEIYEMPKETIIRKTSRAKKNILAYHRWEHCADRMLEAIKSVERRPVFDNQRRKLGWVSTWNTKCGIATYSKFLVDNILDRDTEVVIFANRVNDHELFDQNEEKNVERVWQDAGDVTLDDLYLSIIKHEIDTLVFQFNFGFFNLYALEKLIIKLKKENIKIYLTLHSVQDVDKEDFKASLGWISETLQMVDGILVHNISDLNILKSFGLIDNVMLFPHGVVKRETNVAFGDKIKKELNIENKKIIASYGFLLPHKGIKELIEAFAIINKKRSDTHLLLVNALYPNTISQEYMMACKKRIEELNIIKNVTMINDFLSDDESFRYLDLADLLVMPYKETQESSSAAVRYAISTRKPIVCTPINIFRDVEDVVHFTQSTSVEAIAEKIIELINDEKLLYQRQDIQQRWIDEHDWIKIAKRLENIIGYGNG